MPAYGDGVGTPPDTALPFFAYGLLKSRELAHRSVIRDDLERSQDADLIGATLRYRDGLPLLDDQGTGGLVRGELLWLDAAGEAYSRVGDFEPRRHYRWVTRNVLIGDTEVAANVLAGRSPRKGSTHDEFESWTSAEDPVLTSGLCVVTDLGFEVALDEVPAMPGTSPELWSRFFRMSAAYLLLWSAVERFTSLAFGPALDPMERVRLLDELPSFRAAVLRLEVPSGQRVVDSRDPSSHYRIRDDGSGAAQFWYAIRSNLSHRGKSAFQDGQLLRSALIDLHDVVKVMLRSELPHGGVWPRHERADTLLSDHCDLENE
jgi:hypothetical protein